MTKTIFIEAKYIQGFNQDLINVMAERMSAAGITADDVRTGRRECNRVPGGYEWSVTTEEKAT
ncbi:MAG: hypothetical protein IMZ62_12690 [Chloroflexi bacterium]|nr:hypothetical protein [Chloroflexota bacterium]